MTNNNNLNLNKTLPLIIAIAILWISIFIPLNSSMNINDGHVIYTLDDAYIHMAIAKHFAKDGVFGVTKYEFTPSSSSPLWTLLLSFFYYIFGISELTPLLLNFFFASIFILILFYFLRFREFSNLTKTTILVAFIYFIPLPYLVMTGLEHILQIILSLMLILGLINSISSENKPDIIIKKLPIHVYVMAFLLVSTRYEGLFLIGAITLFLLIKTEFFKACLFFLSGILPVIIYGIISVLKGWYFIPNSILLKGKTFNPFSIKSILLFLYNGMRQVIYNIHILVLLIVVFFLLLKLIEKYKLVFTKYSLASYLFIIVTILHLLFAKTGLFLSINYQLRYDAYLLSLGLIAILLMPLDKWHKNIKGNRAKKVFLYILIFFIILPMSERSLKTLYKTSMASSNTYSNQYMLGEFINKYYKNERILLNDIGGINFLTDIRCLDILGLSSKKPSELLLKRKLNTHSIEQLNKDFGAKIAIVNDIIINGYGGIPKTWILIGQWKLKKSVISPLDTISFYALNKYEIKRLSNAMKEFSKVLPDTLYHRVLK